MKIALVMLTGGSLSGGAAKHLRFVVPRILADPSVTELRVFLPEKSLAPVPADWNLSEWPTAERWLRRPVLKRELARFAPDVVLVPSARWIGTKGAKTVVMVRNMEPFTPFVAGNRLLERLRNRALMHVALRACGRADTVIAVSHHVRDVIGRLDPASLGKTQVVYHGIEDPPAPNRPSALEQLGDQPFVFTAGSIRPARGLTDIIDAWTSGRIAPLPHLVVAGATYPHMEAFRWDLVCQASSAGVADKIVWTGNLSSAEMSWCFRQSRLFVMTSRAEACPNTVLEAMRHGCLSVSTDTPPMPEFFQDTALYYSAGDHLSLVAAVRRALDLGEAEERQLRASAFRRSQQFDWDRTAAETLEVLRRTAALTPGWSGDEAGHPNLDRPAVGEVGDGERSSSDSIEDFNRKTLQWTCVGAGPNDTRQCSERPAGAAPLNRALHRLIKRVLRRDDVEDEARFP